MFHPGTKNKGGRRARWGLHPLHPHSSADDL